MIARSRGENERAVDHAGQKRPGASLRALVQVMIGIGALALVIMKAEPSGLAAAVKATRISYLPLAVVASLAVTWLMAYRWGVILNVRCHRIKTRRLFIYYLIGIFFMNFVPGGGVTSDVARLIYVDREVHDKPFVLSTLVYERMVGLFTLLLIGLGATLASRIYRPTDSIFYVSEIILAAAFIASALLMSDWVSSRLARFAKRAGARIGIPRVGDAASRTLETIVEMRRYKGMLVRILLLSVMIRVIWSLGCFVVSQAMGLPLGLPVVFAFISLVDLIRMLPISVGGLGVREWVIVLLFANAGIGREQALMFSFLAFAPTILNAIAGGILYVSRAGLLKARREPAATEGGV